MWCGRLICKPRLQHDSMRFCFCNNENKSPGLVTSTEKLFSYQQSSSSCFKSHFRFVDNKSFYTLIVACDVTNQIFSIIFQLQKRFHVAWAIEKTSIRYLTGKRIRATHVKIASFDGSMTWTARTSFEAFVCGETSYQTALDMLVPLSIHSLYLAAAVGIWTFLIF